MVLAIAVATAFYAIFLPSRASTTAVGFTDQAAILAPPIKGIAPIERSESISQIKPAAITSSYVSTTASLAPGASNQQAITAGLPAPALAPVQEARINATGSPAPLPPAASGSLLPCDTSVSTLYCVYTVQQGDTLGAVALRFGLKDGDVPAAELIAQSNKPDVSNSDDLSIGQKLRIPTRQGVIHTVFGGESYSSIADTYDVPLAQLVAVDINRISDLNKVTVGQEILIPNPKQFAVPSPVAAASAAPGTAGDSSGPSSSSSSSSGSSGGGGSGSSTAVVRGGQASKSGFIWPITGPISSYFGPSHPLGIDVDLYANPNGAIGAAAAGTVTFAGGNACCSYGYYVVINHGNGFETLYGHFSKLSVSTGQKVAQGQLLGYGGRTGYATGNHLHFEVHLNGSIVNPLVYLP